MTKNILIQTNLIYKLHVTSKIELYIHYNCKKLGYFNTYSPRGFE